MRSCVKSSLRPSGHEPRSGARRTGAALFIPADVQGGAVIPFPQFGRLRRDREFAARGRTVGMGTGWSRRRSSFETEGGSDTRFFTGVAPMFSGSAPADRF